MNNRYTFKAKRKDNMEWVYGYLIDDNGNYCIMVGGLDVNFDNLYTIEKDTICQCTGLQDIDGKDIFENDIVSGYGNVFKATVEWNESFCGFYPFCNEETKIFADECKIISNKFDKEVDIDE